MRCSGLEENEKHAGVPRCIVPRLIACHRCCIFHKLKAGPSTSKRITAQFIAILALLQWSGTEPAVSLQYACTSFKVCFLDLTKLIFPW